MFSWSWVDCETRMDSTSGREDVDHPFRSAPTWPSSLRPNFRQPSHPTTSKHERIAAWVSKPPRRWPHPSFHYGSVHDLSNDVDVHRLSSASAAQKVTAPPADSAPWLRSHLLCQREMKTKADCDGIIMICARCERLSHRKLTALPSAITTKRNPCSKGSDSTDGEC